MKLKGKLLAIGPLLSILVLTGCTQNLGGPSSGWSPAVASEGVVYVATRQGEVKALSDKGLADGVDGNDVRWTFRPSGEKKNGMLGAFNTPVVGETLVYVSGIDGYLYAIDKDKGSIGGTGWQRPHIQAKDLKPLVGGPALDRNSQTVVVGSEDSKLYAYQSETGDLLWPPFATGDRIWSTPVIREGVIYFGSQDHNVYAVSLKDGKELWRFPTGGAVVARPLVLENLVVVGSFDKRLYGLDARDGKLRWRLEGGNWFWAGAVANEKTIFAPSMDGNLYALDRGGRLLWKHPMGSAIVSTPVLLPRPDTLRAAPTESGRWLVVATKNGKISVLDPDPNDIGPRREISSFDIQPAEIKAPLRALEDSVFVGAQDGTVRRIDIKGSQVQMWCFHTKDIQCK